MGGCLRQSCFFKLKYHQNRRHQAPKKCFELYPLCNSAQLNCTLTAQRLVYQNCMPFLQPLSQSKLIDTDFGLCWKCILTWVKTVICWINGSDLITGQAMNDEMSHIRKINASTNRHFILSSCEPILNADINNVEMFWSSCKRIFCGSNG